MHLVKCSSVLIFDSSARGVIACAKVRYGELSSLRPAPRKTPLVMIVQMREVGLGHHDRSYGVYGEVILTHNIPTLDYREFICSRF